MLLVFTVRKSMDTMSRPKSIVILTPEYQQLSDRSYQYRVKCGYKPESSRTKQLGLEEFFYWLEQRAIAKIADVKTHDIQSFYTYISDRPNKKNQGSLSAKTTFNIMKTVSDCFSMLQEQGEIQINPVTVLKFPYPRDYAEREILTLEEINQLYDACSNVWERAILSLAYGCGLRVGEVENLKIEDIRLREKIVIVTSGKGNKRRAIPMSPGVARDLSDYYFNHRDTMTTGKDYNEKDRAFMLNNRGGRLREHTCNKYLRRMIAQTQNESLQGRDIGMHCLRHSIATHLIEQGIPLDQVRQFLGHSQLETTQGYTRISKEQIKKMIEGHDD